MKKAIFAAAFFILSLGTSACAAGTNIESTDLSGAAIDGLQINQKLDPESLNGYTESNRYSGDHKYEFEELIIDTDGSDVITYLFGRFGENSIGINGKNDLLYISDVAEALGDNYSKQVYDREQHLSQYTYSDKENSICAEFVYSDFDNCLIWLVIRST